MDSPLEAEHDYNDTRIDLWNLFPHYTTVEIADLFDKLKSGKVRGLVITHNKDQS